MKDLFQHQGAEVRAGAGVRVRANRARALFGELNLSTRMTAQKALALGNVLAEDQDSGEIPEGTWTQYVTETVGMGLRTAQRCMALARDPGQDLPSQYEKVWGMPQSNRGVFKTPAPSQSSQNAPGTTQKEDGQKDDEKPVSVPDDTPEHVRRHMGERQKFTTALHRVRHAKKALEEVAASATYPLVKAGLTVSLIDRIESIERQLDRRVPQEVCEDCKGQTSTCPSCGGKGFLTRDEVEPKKGT